MFEYLWYAARFFLLSEKNGTNSSQARDNEYPRAARKEGLQLERKVQELFHHSPPLAYVLSVLV